MAETFDPLFLEQIGRICAAALCGLLIGLNRDLKHKSAGMRTLGLVSLSACLVSLAALQHLGAHAGPDALSRVVQGVLQGVLTGVGFLGAGVIIKQADGDRVRGLTTAAAVWLTAALGVTCALADWRLIALGLLATIAVLVVPHHVFRAIHGRKPEPDEE